MNISKDLKPITYLKSRAPDLLKQINQTHRPVVITQIKKTYQPEAVSLPKSRLPELGKMAHHVDDYRFDLN